MPKKQSDRTPQELITLEVRQCGFVVYGLGAGANKCSFQGEPLLVFLEKIMKKMFTLKTELNRNFRKLKKDDLSDLRNRTIIKRYLEVGSWAYAVAVNLRPFAFFCKDGPTNPLYFFYIQRLEEIFTKCFAVAHIFGLPDERIAGEQGLLTDFALNGGVELETGKIGWGFNTSILVYYIAYFNTTIGRHPLTYERFGELITSITRFVENHYPKIILPLAKQIKDFLENEAPGFANKKITSPAKLSMVEKLTKIKNRLVEVASEQAKREKVA